MASDPDLWWHLQSGKHFINKGIPQTDPFSHTMPEWHWVDHEWLSDIILFLIYNIFDSEWGLMVLAIIFTFIIGATFYLAASAVAETKPKYKLLAAFIGLIATLPILGVRVQILSALGLALILWFYYRYLYGDLGNWIWTTPPLFLVWANLHGGFVAGLGLMGLIAIAEIIKILLDKYWLNFSDYIAEKTFSLQQLWQWIGVGAASGLITLINPYLWRLHYDIYLTLTDTFMLENISEWLPVTITNYLSHNYIIYLIILGAVLLLNYRKFEPTRWIIALFFLWFSFQSWRNIPLFIIISVGFLAVILQQETGKIFDKILSNTYVVAGIILLGGLTLTQRFSKVVPANLDRELLAQHGNFPEQAVQWIKDNPNKIQGEMFNKYGWGGYLDWRLPDYKVFIDGRMPFWRLPNRHVFKDYQQGINGAETFDILKKYEVDWVLIDNKRPMDWKLRTSPDWENVYRDNQATIFVKSNNTQSKDSS